MTKVLWAVPAIMIAMQLPGFADTILPGTEIRIRTEQPIHVSRMDRGRIFPARVARDVPSRDGRIAIPEGSPAELIVRQTGRGEFALDLESITANGMRYVLDVNGPQYNLPRDSYNDGNGVVGSILGAIAGANGEQVEPRGREIRVPRDTVIRFQLQEPLHVANWRDPGYRHDGEHYHRDHDWYR